jgi:predicted transcriptional regulator YdeE
MKQSFITLPQDIKLVGIKTRTNNAHEMNSKTPKIPQTLKNYFDNHLSAKILNRVKPETTYCVYTQYESDEHGEYTYFVGEEVSCIRSLDPFFTPLTLPAGVYAKFECGPAPMPEVCIDAWKKIWRMKECDLGGKRAYIADFEIYDDRAKDTHSTIMNIYIGLEKPKKK